MADTPPVPPQVTQMMAAAPQPGAPALPLPVTQPFDALAAAEARKKVKEKTPEEQIELLLKSQEFQAKAKFDPSNEDEKKAVRDTLLMAAKGDAKGLAAFQEANLKVLQARLEVGLAKDKPRSEQPDIKLSKEQEAKIKEAEEAQAKALDKLVAKIPEEQDKETAKTFLKLAAETTNGPQADAEHAKAKADIVKRLTEQSRRRWNPFASKPPSALIADIDAAKQKTPEEQKAAADALIENLKTNPQTRDLSDAARQEIFVALTSNTGAVLEANAKANPIDSAVKGMADTALAEIKNAPVNMIRESMTGLPPGATTAMNMASKITGGRV